MCGATAGAQRMILEKWFLFLYNYVPRQAYPGQTTKTSIFLPQFCPLSPHGLLATLGRLMGHIGFNEGLDYPRPIHGRMSYPGERVPWRGWDDLAGPEAGRQALRPSGDASYNRRVASWIHHLIVTAQQTLTTRFRSPAHHPTSAPPMPPLDLAAAAAREKG